MSVGFFLGIRNAFSEQAQHKAATYIEAANRALTVAGVVSLHGTDDSPERL